MYIIYLFIFILFLFPWLKSFYMGLAAWNRSYVCMYVCMYVWMNEWMKWAKVSKIGYLLAARDVDPVNTWYVVIMNG